jgi:hypothetical protein
MIKAIELRIGNWFNLYDNYNSQVTGLTNTGSVWFVKGPNNKECAFSTSMIKPIPLNEEWLLKFGFSFVKLDNSYKTRFLRIRLLTSGNVAHLTNEGYLYQIKLDYVHQVQNLYFTLHGEELQLKE